MASRVALLRDHVANELALRLPAEIVETCAYADHTRSELKTQRRIMVAKGPRVPTVEQGPDTRTATIEVALVKSLTPYETGTPSNVDIRDDRMTQVDECDELFETILSYWTPNGELSIGGWENYSFLDLNELPMDMEKFHQTNMFLAVVQLNYADGIDD